MEKKDLGAFGYLWGNVDMLEPVSAHFDERGRVRHG